MKTMKKQIIRILQLVLGFILTLYFYESGFDGIWDGPCSGLRGYERHCYIIAIEKLAVIYIVVPLILMYWINLNWFYLGSLLSIVSTYLLFLIGANEHFFFSNQPYMPTFLGAWVGLYVLAIGLVCNFSWRKFNSSKII